MASSTARSTTTAARPSRRPRRATRAPSPRTRLRPPPTPAPARRTEPAPRFFPPPPRGKGRGRPLVVPPLPRRRPTADERGGRVAGAGGLAVHLGEKPPRQ